MLISEFWVRLLETDYFFHSAIEQDYFFQPKSEQGIFFSKKTSRSEYQKDLPYWKITAIVFLLYLRRILWECKYHIV